MPKLPPNPNLEQLKNQAKGLLKALNQQTLGPPSVFGNRPRIWPTCAITKQDTVRAEALLRADHSHCSQNRSQQRV